MAPSFQDIGRLDYTVGICGVCVFSLRHGLGMVADMERFGGRDDCSWPNRFLTRWYDLAAIILFLLSNYYVQIRTMLRTTTMLQLVSDP